MTLCKSDVQKFMKRLRYATGDLRNDMRVKYYLAGEYGPQTWRPHYHAIIFNASVKAINECWQLGHVDIGQNATPATMAYCAKYICKPKKIPLHKNDDRLKEFSHMSRGLGLNYITDATKQYHLSTLNSSVKKAGGYSMCLPRYYRDKIFTQTQKDIINTEFQIKHHLKEWKLINEIGIVDYQRLKQDAARQANKSQIFKENLRNKL